MIDAILSIEERAEKPCNWPRCHGSPNPCFAWCKCVCHASKASEKPVGADLSDVLIEGDSVAVGAFRVSHEPCGATLLFTTCVHMDTLVRIAAEHDCAKPDPGWNDEGTFSNQGPARK